MDATPPAMPLDVLDLERTLAAIRTPNCLYFPIRHHSPACAWHLEQVIREVRPSAVLIEGPASFKPLIPAILDPATKTPVAVYTHFIDVQRKIHKPVENELDLGPSRFAAYYPFCEYSPELIALRVGTEVGAALRFIDLDYPDQVLAEHTAGLQLSKPRVQTLMQERYLQHSKFLNALAKRSGCRDFNEMWDHLFEADFRSRSAESFIREVTTYCFYARYDANPASLDADGTNARERAMAAAIADEQQKHRPGDAPILVVTGGFHTIALPDLVKKAPQVKAPRTWSSDEVQQALIRYGFEQLDALNGYSAGMPSPSYYNRVWGKIKYGISDANAAAATDIVVEIGAITRKKDMQIALSTADEIAALQQARLLAALRGHPGPTREDLLDGIRSCFVKGAMDAEGTVLMGIVSHVLTGKDIGEVPSHVGMPPIVASFRKEAERARLEIQDSVKKRISLEIYRRENHRRTSRFLHSLNFLAVPFAAVVAGPDFVRGTGLERIHEHWQYAWSPMTEGALVQAAIYGSTVEEAAMNRLREAIARLEEEGHGRSATTGVAMLVRACRMGLHRHTSQLLSLIAAKINEEPSFTEAISAANQLLLLWQSREPLEAHSLVEVPQLLNAAYQRACYLLATLAQCPDSELHSALDSLSSVRELLAAGSNDLLDEELFWEAAFRLIDIPNQSHTPYCTICGAAAGLLYSAGRIDQSKLEELVIGYLVGLSDSEKRVGFLHGLLKTCREAAWQNLQLVHSLDEIIANWDEGDFISALPALRLALAELTPRETDKVAALVASLYGSKSIGELVQNRITEGELESNRRITALVLETLTADGLGHWAKGVLDE
jgi:hypothetical protein